MNISYNLLGGGFHKLRSILHLVAIIIAITIAVVMVVISIVIVIVIIIVHLLITATAAVVSCFIFRVL